MSSDPRFIKNLVSVSGFGYRENILSGVAISSAVSLGKLAVRSRIVRLTHEEPVQPPPTSWDCVALPL